MFDFPTINNSNYEKFNFPSEFIIFLPDMWEWGGGGLATTII